MRRIRYRDKEVRCNSQGWCPSFTVLLPSYLEFYISRLLDINVEADIIPVFINNEMGIFHSSCLLVIEINHIYLCHAVVVTYAHNVTTRKGPRLLCRSLLYHLIPNILDPLNMLRHDPLAPSQFSSHQPYIT